MTVNTIGLTISTPTEPILPGRGFYQLEEEALFIQVGPFVSSRRFYSYLEGTGILLHFDRHGRLIFVEIEMARRHWRLNPHLKAPTVVEPADIRWLNFRNSIKPPRIETNARRTVVKLSFEDTVEARSYYAADSVIVQSDPSDRLCALWVTDITDDIAGQEIGFFRKKSRAKQSYYS
ncbi:MAG: hypothetical protein JSV52_03745 [Candidatus Zixiibacteriota bacterium]|nr:MAG: hypothetical protein JSV52_03745 [candidate division Zixibacteria bacterium]